MRARRHLVIETVTANASPSSLGRIRAPRFPFLHRLPAGLRLPASPMSVSDRFKHVVPGFQFLDVGEGIQPVGRLHHQSTFKGSALPFDDSALE